jgi:hypothetical protein
MLNKPSEKEPGQGMSLAPVSIKEEPDPKNRQMAAT